MTPFKEFPKIARLSREVVITEKIDGTNASVWIPKTPEEAAEIAPLAFLTSSRTRWITPLSDNAGFSKWAYEHMDDILLLGPGHHFGEWWGSGIQRGYGLPKGEKRFSLFNTTRWEQEALPDGLYVVPELYRGDFTTEAVLETMYELQARGSHAAPGFKSPEGVVIFHTHGNVLFKKTFEGDDKGKGYGA